MHMKRSSAKWRPFCPGGDELGKYYIFWCVKSSQILWIKCKPHETFDILKPTTIQHVNEIFLDFHVTVLFFLMATDSQSVHLSTQNQTSWTETFPTTSTQFSISTVDQKSHIHIMNDFLRYLRGVRWFMLMWIQAMKVISQLQLKNCMYSFPVCSNYVFYRGY